MTTALFATNAAATDANRPAGRASLAVELSVDTVYRMSREENRCFTRVQLGHFLLFGVFCP